MKHEKKKLAELSRQIPGMKYVLNCLYGYASSARRPLPAMKNAEGEALLKNLQEVLLLEQELRAKLE